MENDNKRNKARNNSKNKNSGNGSAGTTGKKRDISSKNVFHNPLLCAQFLRDNVDIPMLKNVQPEDIEDVSERYRPYLGTEFETDIVKRIQLHDKTNGMKCEPLFLISLIEQKSGRLQCILTALKIYGVHMAGLWERNGAEKARHYQQEKFSISNCHSCGIL